MQNVDWRIDDGRAQLLDVNADDAAQTARIASAGALATFDGPSRAIASALSQIPVRRDIAMTGEITLRGKVLPIGGLKEKLLAAHRQGIFEVILPKDNEKDLADIPENIRKEMKLHFVTSMDEVLKLALEREIVALPLAPAATAAELAARPEDNLTH